MIKKRWKTSVLNCKTYPGADCNSDHQLLVATMKIRLHGKKHQSEVIPLNLEELINAMKYEIEVSNRFDALEAIQEEKTPEDMWKNTKTVLLDVANDIIGKVKKNRKKNWITEETIRLIEEKRAEKGKDTSKYKQLKAEVQKSLRVDKQKQIHEICDDLDNGQKNGRLKKIISNS